MEPREDEVSEPRESFASSVGSQLSRRMRAGLDGLWPGVRLGWVPVVLALLAHVPGRRVYAENEALHGRPAWQFLCAGLLGDLVYVGPALVLAFVIPLGVGVLLTTRWPRIRAMTVAHILGSAIALAIVVAAWMFSVGAIESKLERGLYPTYLETRSALGSSSFVTGQFPTLFLDRYWKTSLIVLIVVTFLVAGHFRASLREVRSFRGVIGFVVGGFLLFAICGGLLYRGRVFFPRTGGYLETRSPLETIALGKFPSHEHAAVTDGMRQLFASRAYSAEEEREGLRVLGYPEQSVERLHAFEGNELCWTRHPLYQALDRGREPLADVGAASLLSEVEALSRALFGEALPAPIVWQVAMESFRGDDIHAIQPLAPEALTPVMNRLYQDEAHVIAFHRAFQGGFRTAQSLSSLLCGVGSLPFNMAVVRDIGHFPLRCLPDVLADAKFETHAFYSSDMAYDGMLEFFRYHGVEVTQAADMPEGLPVGSWRGISDRALYEQVLLQTMRRSEEELSHAQYKFVLTLSGHHPFARPTDMPEEVAHRAALACKASPWAKPDDCARLAVIAYADHALGEFLEKLERSPLAKRSIVILSADHATSEIGLWPGSSEEKRRAHVPYAIYLPGARIDTAADPSAVGTLVTSLRTRAKSQVLSLADSPRLLASLLSSTHGFRSIPESWRFHTLGGQALSPHFAFAARPTARIWGTDSAAYIFSADADGNVSPYEKKNSFFNTADDLDAINPSLRGPAAFLSSFAKGYLRRCEGDVRLRSDVSNR